ncbi:MAG TPA: replication-associated recombination protein A [Fibrobacteraceae bacterium]|jgi:putative ATPase|nr:replication-associated recombination protein A [Fibrobacter sp.]HOG67882.1 replication-associated recombination protein A [Fibrobacteraceae bacterium]HPW94991.1 replication-associated recombination protein A [Fibrobacteraceae bacterium]
MDNSSAPAPLAERLRPKSLEDFLGQNKIMGPKSLLRKSLENDCVPSMIFWGPPGCGKTTLAHIIKGKSQKNFICISAISSGVKEVKSLLAEAREPEARKKGTILFIDEIHRFNKGQQDALLGAVEDGTITLIGATTENPGFEVNKALLSRCQLILFAPLSEDDLKNLLDSALKTHPKGLLRTDISIAPEVVEKLVHQSDGDARYLLNQIEWIVGNLGDKKELDLTVLDEIQYKKPLRYDKSGEEHYNLISVFHKSIRGSDPDAALYWLHRMLQGGEDPRFILRRLMRIAMEDIGLADPNALLLATSAREAFDFMGVPEGLIALDELAVYLSLAPKSNSLEIAGMTADQIIQRTGMLPVPKAFRNPVTRVGRELGYGEKYEYDHDSEGAYSGQDHLPSSLNGTVIYRPTLYGKEKQLAERLQSLNAIKKKKKDSL